MDSEQSKGVGAFIKRLFHPEPVAQGKPRPSTEEITWTPEQELTPGLVRQAVQALEMELRKPYDNRSLNRLASFLTIIGTYFVAGSDKEKANGLYDSFYKKWLRSRSDPSLLVGEALVLHEFFQSVVELDARHLSTVMWYVPGGNGIYRLGLGFSQEGSFRVTNYDSFFGDPQTLHEIGIGCSSSCYSQNHQVWRPPNQ